MQNIEGAKNQTGTTTSNEEPAIEYKLKLSPSQVLHLHKTLLIDPRKAAQYWNTPKTRHTRL